MMRTAVEITKSYIKTYRRDLESLLSEVGPHEGNDHIKPPIEGG